MDVNQSRTWRKKDRGLIQKFPDQDTEKVLTRGPAPYLHTSYDWPPAAGPTPQSWRPGKQQAGRAEMQQRLRVSRRGPGGVRARGGQGVSAAAPTLY